jgi:hypothetical protein
MNINDLTNEEITRHYKPQTENEAQLIERIAAMDQLSNQITLFFDHVDLVSTENLTECLDECTDKAVKEGIIIDAQKFDVIFKPFYAAFKKLDNEIDEQAEDITILERAVEGNPMTAQEFTKHMQNRARAHK